MNVLVIGSGGREHAISWKIKQSALLNKLVIAPGNAGTANLGLNIDVSVNDFESIKNIVLSHEINLVVVGPEDPLVNGIVDFFSNDTQLKNISIIGPDKLGAQLEGSKEFSKIFMEKNNIPTAKYASFTKDNLSEGLEYLQTINPPFVLKADGLAAGKGVLIIDSLKEAQEELTNMLANNKFGNAGKKVVIEEFLKGIELSVFVLTDGKSYKILPEAKDYKRIGEGDKGLNTGGMGAISPVPFASKEFLDKVEERVVIPTIEGLKNENIKYKGFIFIGLMNVNGDPFVIEYNVRMGDPETEVVIPRINSDLLKLLYATGKEELKNEQFEVNPQFVTTIMAVSKGYPEDYEKGKLMKGLENVTESILFHAGTKLTDSNVVTNGGRVIAVSSFGETMDVAISKSYKSLSLIDFEGIYYRKDIGFDLK